MKKVESYNEKLKSRMVSTLNTLSNKYGEEVLDSLWDLLDRCESYDQLLDAASVIFSFDGDMAALAAVNNELASEMDTDEDIVKYVNKSIPDISKIFNWDRKMVENHIILTHLMNEDLRYSSDPVSYEEDEGTFWDGLAKDIIDSGYVPKIPTSWDELANDIINSNSDGEEIYDNIDVSSPEKFVESINNILKYENSGGASPEDNTSKSISSILGAVGNGKQVKILSGTPEDILNYIKNNINKEDM